jgi:small RNA 2'-O-methyltransferase
VQILDIGCGDGRLLAALSEPAFVLPPPRQDIPPEYLPSPQEIRELYTAELYALDVDASELSYAVEVTKPRIYHDRRDPDEDPPRPETYEEELLRAPFPRWTPLEVQIWKGSLADVNPAFIGVECIVSTEVCVTFTSSSCNASSLQRRRIQY